MIFQRILLVFCKTVDWFFHNNFGRFSWGNTDATIGSSITYLINWGPPTLCVRNGESVWKMGACAVTAEWDGQGQLKSCKPKLFDRKPGDIFFFGRRKVEQEYVRLNSHKRWELIDSF